MDDKLRTLNKGDLDLLEKCKYIGDDVYHPDHDQDKDYG